MEDIVAKLRDVEFFLRLLPALLKSRMIIPLGEFVIPLQFHIPLLKLLKLILKISRSVISLYYVSLKLLFQLNIINFI